MNTREKFREVAHSWTGTQAVSAEQASLELTRARGEAEAALRSFGRALMQDAQVHVSEAVSGVRRRVGVAEIDLELMVTRVPLLGPRVAVELFNRTHPGREGDALQTRPTNTVDPDDLAREEANLAADYLDCIGVHVA